jgi:predicted nucleotidyltransferase
MKTKLLFLINLFIALQISAQTIIRIQNGTSISVPPGASICADIIDILEGGHLYANPGSVCQTAVVDSHTTQFTEQVSLYGVFNGSVAWGDYDNDGDLDILLTGLGDKAVSKIYRNNYPEDTFTEQQQLPVLPAVFGSSVAWGDCDNDGDLDILLTGSSQALVYQNNYPDSTFTTLRPISQLRGVFNGSVAWGDYDNDGDLDILLAEWSDTKIYRNNYPVTTFTEQTSIDLPGIDDCSVAWGDCDNDGDLDILLSGKSGSGNITRIYRNDQNNTFVPLQTTLPGVSRGSVAWGDYDNDGYLDILLTGSTGSTNISKVYRNNHNNTFTKQDSLIGVSSSSAVWGDYDNDGYLDILLTGNTGGGMISRVYRNNHNSTFTELPLISLTLQGVEESSAIWGDYDNDGDLDILLTGVNASGLPISKIYRNNNITANTKPGVPSNLTAMVNGNDVTFSWSKSTDGETLQNGLKYNMVIGTKPDSVDKLSPMSDRNTGYRRVVNLGNTNHNNSWIIKGLPNGLYYWSVQAIDNNFAGSDFSDEQIFTIPAIHFTKNWENPYLPMNIYITSAQIYDVDLDLGDEIAVFDGNNCVGTIVLTAPFPSGGYIPVIVSTDDPTTPQVDGFVPGHSISYKFWDSNNTLEMDNVIASYSQGDGTFSSLGTASVGLEVTHKIRQDVTLMSGWNIFSLIVKPDNLDLLNVLEPLITSGKLVKVQDENGNAIEQLLPPIGWVNNIGNYSATEGYYLKVNAATTLSITAQPVQLPINIPLKSGWNIISYPVLVEQDALALLQPLITTNQLIKVQDGAGNAIEQLPQPIGWVNNIGNFKPGEGYYLKVNTATSLTLDEPIVLSAKKESLNEKNSMVKTITNHFQPVFTSPYLAINIYVDQADLIGSAELGLGDEIGIFDGNYCVGASALSTIISPTSPLAIIASTDDPTTQVTDGFIQGHSISYKFWISSAAMEVSEYTEIYSMGNGTFASQGSALVSFTNITPVELTSFTANVQDNKVKLNWETATEINNYGFEIERNITGSENWKKLGFITGNGNSTSPKQYEFLDKNPAGGTKFIYRLKQIDMDGQFKYSNEIEVEIMPTQFELFQNYPNPFNPITNIKFSLPHTERVKISIYNSLGEEVLLLVNKDYEAGFYNIELNASNLSSGIYVYRMETANFVDSKKLLLLK